MGNLEGNALARRSLCGALTPKDRESRMSPRAAAREGERDAGERPALLKSAVAIETIDLRRSYGSRRPRLPGQPESVEAVRGLNVIIERGEIFGLLGPNGAGKTTIIKLLTTLLLPTSGRAYVFGFDITREIRQIRRSIGCVFGGEKGFYERLSAMDNLRYFSELYGVPPSTQRHRIPELLELVGLAGRERERVERYSRGMRQRLHIARGLLHDPELLFLDEPTIGIDPVGARDLRALIHSLKERGKTILLTTHYMFEADALCDRIAVIAKGRIVAEGTPAGLKAQVADCRVVEIEAFGLADGAMERLRSVPGVTSVAIEEREQAQLLLVQSARGLELTQRLLVELDGTRVGRVTAREPTLEDAYIALVEAAR